MGKKDGRREAKVEEKQATNVLSSTPNRIFLRHQPPSRNDFTRKFLQFHSFETTGDGNGTPFFFKIPLVSLLAPSVSSRITRY